MKTTKKPNSAVKAKSAAKTGNMTKPGLFSNPNKLFRVFIIACAAVLVTTTIGYAGFSKYQERTLKSKAANYARVIYQNGFTASVCKQMTPYGYRLNVIGTKPANTTGDVNLVVTTTGGVNVFSGNQSSTWWGGTVTAFNVYAGSDRWQFEIGFRTEHYGSIYPKPVPLAYTPYC